MITARGCAALVRTRGGTGLPAWVEQGESTIAPGRSFATGPRKEWDAVTTGRKPGLELGAIEGQ